MKIFDVHTHVWPDKIAAKTLVYLQAKSQNLPVFNDGTAAGLRERAVKAGYTAWMNLPVVTRPGQAHSVNEHAAAANVFPALSMGGVHPDDEDMCGELQHIMDLGLHGVKLHPEYQEFNPLEARMEPLWAFCESHGLPVLVHAGNDVGFQAPFHSRPGDFAEVKRRHAGLTLICAHLGGWLVWDEFERDLMGHDVFIDTSFSAMYMTATPGRFERLIRGHGIEHVLYGTDSPWQSLESGVADIMTLSVSEADKQAIFWRNAAKIWKLDDMLPSSQKQES